MLNNGFLAAPDCETYALQDYNATTGYRVVGFYSQKRLSTLVLRRSTKIYHVSKLMSHRSKIKLLSYSSGGYPIMLIAIPLHSSTATFCPIGKFCKVTTFFRIVQGKFLV